MLRDLHHLRASTGRLRLSHRRDAERLGRGPRARPSPTEIAAWLGDPCQRASVLSLLRDELGHHVDPLRDDPRHHAARLSEAFARGDILAKRQLPPQLDRRRDEREQPTKQEATEKEVHVLDFVVEYPDGKPAPGYDWELVHPAGKKEKGTLGADALVHRDGVPEGGYTLVLKEVERVAWADDVVSVAEKARLRAKVSGFADGASAKIRIFREFEESDAEVLDTLDAKVEKDWVEVEYQFDDRKDDERKAMQGVLRLVAEVAVENKKHWGKTTAPLELQLKTVASARWTTERLFASEDGSADSTSLRIETTGYPDGTKAEVVVWRASPEGDDEELATFADVVLDGGVGTLDFDRSEDPEGKASPLEGTTFRRAGEYYARVKVDGDDLREITSKVCALEPIALL